MTRASSLAFAAALAASLAPSIAAAGPSAGDRAAAQGLFDQARTLMAKGDFAKACPMLEESQRLDPGQGTEFNLAKCYEGAGKTASAWTMYLQVADEAKAAGQADRERVAREHADAIAARVPKLAIRVDDKSPGLVVTRDGTAIGSAQWGVPVPTDPGPHEIAATAPGRERFATRVDVHEGANEAVVPVLKQAGTAATPAPAASPSTTRPAANPAREAPSEQPKGGLGTQKTLALVAGGVGVVGVAVGTVFGLKAKSKHDDAAPYCSGNTCTQDGVDLRHGAVAAGNLSTVFFAVGLAGLAGGAALWLTAPDASTTTGVRVAPTIGSTQGGAVVEGTW